LVGVCAGGRPSGPGRTLIHLHRLTCSQHVSRPWPSMCRLIKYISNHYPLVAPSVSPRLISIAHLISHLPSPSSHLAAPHVPARLRFTSAPTIAIAIAIAILAIIASLYPPSHHHRPCLSPSRPPAVISARQLLGCASTPHTDATRLSPQARPLALRLSRLHNPPAAFDFFRLFFSFSSFVSFAHTLLDADRASPFFFFFLSSNFLPDSLHLPRHG
jgi:hypothetical protein